MEFTREQRQAIETGAEKALVVAGPGSGKTTVLTERLCILLERGVPAERILLLSFTRASSKEMEERFFRNMGIRAGRPRFSTIHALCFSLLREDLGYKKEDLVNLYEKMDWLSQYYLEKGILREEVQELLPGLIAQISYFKSIGERERIAYLQKEKQEDFLALYHFYEESRKKRGKLDFEDLLLEVLRILMEKGDLAKAWQSRFSHILVDEFQDLSLVQYEIIKALAKSPNALFVVGDEDQSIYGFRGASPGILLSFTKDYPNCERIFLSDNFRSYREIVELSKRLIGKNKERFQKKLQGRQGSGGKAKYYALATGKEEARLLLQHIEEAKEEGCPLEEMAILCRSRKQIPALLPLFMERGIPYSLTEDVQNVFQHFVGKDILAYLRLTINKESRGELLQILNKPYRGLLREKIQREESPFSDLKKAYRGRKEERALILLEKQLQKMQELPVQERILYIRKDMGYEQYLESFAKKKNRDFEELQSLLEELTAMAEQTEGVEAFFRFVEKFNADCLQRQKEESGKGVRIMTYHGAKGLEFDEVFLPDCIEGIIPDGRAKTQEELEEERRSFYVALTRARKKIHIYVTKERYSKKVKPSRFIPELLGG